MTSELMTAAEVARVLQVVPRDVPRLIRAGMLQPGTRVGRQVVFDREDVLRRVRKPVTAPHPAALVVRLSDLADVRGQDAAFDRDWVGFSTALTPEQLQDAVRAWWQLDNPERYLGKQHALVATFVGFVVGVYSVSGFDRDRGQVRFDLAPASPRAKAAFADRRLKTGRGGAIHHLPQDSLFEPGS